MALKKSPDSPKILPSQAAELKADSLFNTMVQKLKSKNKRHTTARPPITTTENLPYPSLWVDTDYPTHFGVHQNRNGELSQKFFETVDIPNDNNFSFAPKKNPVFNDPSEPIYTDPSLFEVERSRSLRSIVMTSRDKKSRDNS